MGVRRLSHWGSPPIGLAGAGLVDRTDSGFKHAVGGTADELVDYYSRRRVAVIDTVYNKPTREFAD